MEKPSTFLRSKTAILALVASLLLLTILSADLPSGPPSSSEGPFGKPELDYQQEAARIKAWFASKSVTEAVAEFRSAYRDRDEEAIHVLEHVVGEELYAREGRGGLVFCPASPLSGCYHGFFAKAFAEEGRPFIQQSEAACRARSDFMGANGCVHGIGHGLLALEGRNNLPAALADCRKISYTIPFGAKMCETGVFMEYNTESVHGPGGERIAPRAWNDRYPYGPCPDVAARHQAACYLQLPHWWGEVLANDFLRMGSLCAKVPGAENRENCFRSIGMVIVRENRGSTEAVRTHCGSLPDTPARFFCVEEAAKLQRILGNPDALETCSILAEAGARECREGVATFLCEELGACGT